MLKNAFLSLKKNLGKSFLLFIIMCVIANLVIAGLSIKNATSKSMDQVRTSLGSEVTFSYNIRNMMQNREKGDAMDSAVNAITVKMADQLKDLQYVEHYNYTVNVSVSSEDIDPVEMSASDETTESNPMFGGKQPKMLDQNDFTVLGNTTMAYISEFTKENYVLKSGRLLTEEDAKTKNCVIESNLASDNDLEVGSTFTVTSTNEDDEEISVTLKVVGIYEIETTSEMGGMMSNRQNPINQIYTSLNVAQTLNDSTSQISSAIYYLDDPDHIESFKELAQSSSDIDFETYTLDANDEVYQRSISSLENMESFATIFLWVVIGAGSAILCLILILTMRSRFYEFGVFLSLGQAKIKIILQQLVEIGFIAVIAFVLSLGTGKMVSNVVSSMLESSQNNQTEMKMEITDDEPSTDTKPNRNGFFDKAMQAPTNTELDVSLTSHTIVQLAEITALICVVSVILPSIYILRLSPREILVKKEG